METVPHIVGAGDTLETIAEAYYGDADLATFLGEFNGIHDSGSLKEGATVEVPFDFFETMKSQEVEPDHKVVELSPKPSQYISLAARELSIGSDQQESTRGIEGKWLYGIAEGEIVLTIRCDKAALWQVDDLRRGSSFVESRGTVTLDRDVSYAFFLSPIELSDKARSALVEKFDDLRWLTHLDSPAAAQARGESIDVVDCFQRALDLQEQWHGPALEKYQEWFFSKERTNKRFIAMTLKTIIEQGDAPNIADDLRSSQPKQRLDEDAELEKEERRPVELAAWHIARTLDCEDRRILEQDLLERGPEGARAMMMHWGASLTGLAQSDEGRLLLDTVAQEVDAAPRRLVFAASSEIDWGFGEDRYALLAGQAVVEELLPSALKHLFPDWERSPREDVAAFLERLGAERKLYKFERQIQSNLKNGRKLTYKEKSRKQVVELVHQAKAASKAKHLAATPPSVLRSKSLLESYDRRLAPGVASVVSMVQIVNLGLSIRELMSSQDDKLVNAIGTLGSAADFGAAILSAREALLKANAKRPLAVLGIIAGVCDAIGFGVQANKAADHYDRDKAGALVVGAVGSTMMAVGAASLAFPAVGAAGGAALGVSAGVFAGLSLGLGAVLVFAGAGLAALLSNNPYEEFAIACFLGQGHGADSDSREWSPVDLPTRKIEDEKRALVTLLSAFRLCTEGASSLRIEPGMLGEGDIIELYGEVHYNPRTVQPNFFVLKVDPNAQTAVQTLGVRPVDATVKPSRDAKGRLTAIAVKWEEAKRPAEVLVNSSMTWRARIVLAGSDFATVPATAPSGASPDRKREPWVRVGTATFMANNGLSLDDSLHEEGDSAIFFYPGMSAQT